MRTTTEKAGSAEPSAPLERSSNAINMVSGEGHHDLSFAQLAQTQDDESLLPFYAFSFISNIYFVNVGFLYYSRWHSDSISARHHNLKLVYAACMTFLNVVLSLNMPPFRFMLGQTPCIVHFVIQHLFGLLLVLSLGLRIVLISIRHYNMVVGIAGCGQGKVEMTPFQAALMHFIGVFTLVPELNRKGVSPSPSSAFGRTSLKNDSPTTRKRRTHSGPAAHAQPSVVRKGESAQGKGDATEMRDRKAVSSFGIEKGKERGSLLGPESMQDREKAKSLAPCSAPEENTSIMPSLPSCIDGSWIQPEEICLAPPTLDAPKGGPKPALAEQPVFAGLKPAEMHPAHDPFAAHRLTDASSCMPSTTGASIPPDATPVDIAFVGLTHSVMSNNTSIFNYRGLVQLVVCMVLFAVLVIIADLMISTGWTQTDLPTFAICPLSAYIVLYSILLICIPVLFTALIPVARMNTAKAVWGELCSTTILTCIFIILMIAVNVTAAPENVRLSSVVLGEAEESLLVDRYLPVGLVVSGFLAFTVSLGLPLVWSVWKDWERHRLLKDVTMDGFARVLHSKVLFDAFKKTMAKDFAINALFYEELQELKALEHKASNITDRANRLSETRRWNRQSIGNLLNPHRFRSGTGRTEKCVPCEESKKRVRRIWELFVKSGSPYEVNLPSDVRRQIRLRIKQNWLTSDIFADAEREVVTLMFTNSFPRFVRDCREML